MNWNFSAWAIRNPVPPVLLFVVLCAFGIYSFMGLPITRFPNIDVPVIAVTVTDNGTAPAELETQVTKKVEDAIAGLTGVKNITSTITDGKSTTAAEFRLEVDTDRALNDVKDALAAIRGDLPRTVDEPIIQRIDVEGQSILTYAVSAPTMTLEELSWFIDDTVIRDIQGLKGVGRVDRMGGVAREVQVRLDPDRLMALGITAAEVNAQLRATNADLSGGRGEVGGQEQAIRTLAGASTVEGLASTTILIPGGRQVRLSDLGEVVDHYEDPRSFARVDGEPVVAMSIYRAKGASDASVADLVRARVAELEAEYPGVEIERIDDSVTYTYGNYESAMTTLWEGAALAVLVVLLFLRDMRATLIAAVALPLSAIPTFWALDMMGFSLNLVSLLAITLVTGILVDDAIVEIENIVRHIRMGKSPYRAALEAADEIGLAVIAISATIVAVFVPVSFMGGIPGLYFKQFGLTVAMAVFFSLLVARLITPLMAAFFMKGYDHEDAHPGFWRSAAQKLRGLTPVVIAVALAAFAIDTLRPDPAGWPMGDQLALLFGEIAGLGWATIALAAAGTALAVALFRAWLSLPHPDENHQGFVMRAYTGLLRATLWKLPIPTPFMRRNAEGGRTRVWTSFSMRWVTLAAGIGFFLVAMDSTKHLPTGFIPPEDVSRIVTSVELPPGSTLDDTQRATDEIARILGELPEVRSVFVIGGSSPTGTLEKRRASVIVNLVRKAERNRSQQDLEGVILGELAKVPDIRAYYVQERGDRELTVGVLGRDGEAVAAAAAELEAEMRREEMFQNPAALASFARPEIRITPKPDVAADLGVSTEAISQTVRVATVGDAGGNLAKFTIDGRQIPIRVQLREETRGDLALISAMRVPNGAGGSVPLAAAADVGFGQGPSAIERFNRERLVKVGADMAPGFTTGQGTETIMALPAVSRFPEGVRIQETGDAEIQAEMFQSFAAAMGAGILMVFVVLILLFNSVFQPITILMTLPLSVGGVVAALLVTNNAVSMPVVIGILMLMGIVTKNAIMLVDFAVEREKHGVPQVDAIIDAGAKRARPIVMTTIAMSAGMLPAAYGIGEGGEFRAPMAIAVIGGLIVSTVLSLVFIPSLYTIMDDASRGVAWLFRVLFRPNLRDEPGAEGAVAAHGTPGPAEMQPSLPLPMPVPAGPRLVAANHRPEPPRDLPLAAE